VADLEDAAVDEALVAYDKREQELGSDTLRSLETQVVLSIIDNKWREHLAEMDYLRSGIGLRAMGQRDPLVEYQREAYDMFADLVDAVKRDTVRYLFHVQVVQQAPRAAVRSAPAAAQAAGAGSAGGVATMPVTVDKVGRNDPCPCGSGKKFKKCHGAVA
jgi:preprotein translocase subunit SecA